MALAQQNRLPEALAFFDKALALSPGNGELLHNRGVILQQLGRLEEAVASYDRALVVAPGNAGTHYNRGNALVQSRRLEDAVAAYDRTLKLAPGNAQCLMNRGYALSALNRQEEACADYRKAVQLAPNLAETHYNLGLVLAKLNRPQEALAAQDTALRLRPDYIEAHNDRGSTLMALSRPTEALAAFERALQLKADFADAWYNRGVALGKLGRLEDAITSLDRAAQLAPANLQALVLKAYQQAKICDWRTRAADARRLQAAAGQAAIEPFLMLALDDDPARQLAYATAWTRAHHSVATPTLARAAVRPAKVRLGYFSADFHDHATMHLLAGLLERHDRERFEVHLFSFGDAAADAMRARAVSAADHFHDVRTASEEDVAALARRQGIDIAIDLKGYTRDSRPGIFARRAAPVQVSWLGYPGTMGAPFMDYLLADRQVLSQEAQSFCAETVCYLPHCYQPNDNLRAISGRVFSRAELALPETGFVFCCFNNGWKISPAEFDVWMRLLGQVDGSVLWLLKDNDAATANLVREAQARGIGRQRLVFAGRLPHDEHLARQRCADLFLDTFAYNAHTTASDALWAGLPLITKAGYSFAARVAASLLNAVGLPELVTQTAADYERLALELATRPARLAEVKARLAASRLTTPLFDTENFARDIEAAFDAMQARG